MSATPAKRPTPLRGHAVDIIRRPRSTGSILKPLLYAAMLEDGSLTPRMLLPDVPTHYDGFAPENFDRQYRGAVPRRRSAGAFAQHARGPHAQDLRRRAFRRPAARRGHDHAHAPARRLRSHAHPRRRRGQSLGRLRHVREPRRASHALGPADAAPRFRELTVLRGAHARAARRRRHRHRRGLAHARHLVRGAAARRGRPLAQLRIQPQHRLEDRHQLGPARWLGDRQLQPPHGGRVGGQRQRRRPPGTHGLVAWPRHSCFRCSTRCPRATWFVMPTHALRRIDTCENDGYLATGACAADAHLGARRQSLRRAEPSQPARAISASMANNVSTAIANLPGG